MIGSPLKRLQLKKTEYLWTYFMACSSSNESMSQAATCGKSAELSCRLGRLPPPSNNEELNHFFVDNMSLKFITNCFHAESF